MYRSITPDCTSPPIHPPVRQLIHFSGGSFRARWEDQISEKAKRYTYRWKLTVMGGQHCAASEGLSVSAPDVDVQLRLPLLSRLQNRVGAAVWTTEKTEEHGYCSIDFRMLGAIALVAARSSLATSMEMPAW